MSREYTTHLALVVQKNTTTVDFVMQLQKAWKTLPDLKCLADSSLFNPTDWLSNFFTVGDDFRVKVFFNTVYWNRYSNVNYDLITLFEAARPFLLGYNILLVGEDAGESERNASDTYNFYGDAPEFLEVYEKLPVDLQTLQDWCLDLQYGDWTFELGCGYHGKYRKHKPAARRVGATGTGWPAKLLGLRKYQLVGNPAYTSSETAATGNLGNKLICVVLNRALDSKTDKWHKHLVICYANSSITVSLAAAAELLQHISQDESPALHNLLTKTLAETL